MEQAGLDESGVDPHDSNHGNVFIVLRGERKISSFCQGHGPASHTTVKSALRRYTSRILPVTVTEQCSVFGRSSWML